MGAVAANGHAAGARRSLSIAVVGAGFAGVGAAAMLRRAGYEEVTVFESGERVGGVWQDNTYPGAACDVPSHLYEFSFQPNPGWSRRYAPQAEIQAYLEDVAQRHRISGRIRTGTQVNAASWDDARRRWTLQTSAGEHEADVLVTACGQLSVPKVPAIAGAESFAGPSFHTARWRHDVPLAGKRVAIVGTGCSAIQVAPAIQPEVAQLDIYQRSPGWTFPKMDYAYSERALRAFERFPMLARADRAAVFAFMELATAAMTSRRWLLGPFRAIARWQIGRAIEDPELRRKVTPGDELGCKRLMLTDEWYPTLTRANVELIDDPIAQITPTGLRTADGHERAADVLVLATGFATHGFVAPMEITGRDGRRLSDAWSPTPRAYLGISVPSFPNMFLLYGPNTGGGAGSAIYAIEAGVAHVIAALDMLAATGSESIEVRGALAEQFDRELRGALRETVWHTGCTSWYVDEDGDDPSQWPWQLSAYRRRTARIGPGVYELSGSERDRRTRTAA
ncbi:MAG TPA: NAD(P)/FAD-dependent oxidoreductase [Solirubrobacteraceae bacterium]|nr:NAD(P)/FAD-dependent oxidoreductase [Solirubrobacteraceae bacterium]